MRKTRWLLQPGLTLTFLLFWAGSFLVPLMPAEFDALAMAFRVLAVAIFASIFGWWRATNASPFSREGYADWLVTTPWNHRKPLPFGPALLTWWDDLVVVGLGAMLWIDLLLWPKLAELLLTYDEFTDFFRFTAIAFSAIEAAAGHAAASLAFCLGIVLVAFMIGHLLPSLGQMPNQPWKRRLVFALLSLTIFPRAEFFQMAVTLALVTALLHEGRAHALRKLPYDRVGLGQDPLEKIREADRYLAEGVLGRVAPQPDQPQPSVAALLVNRAVFSWWVLLVAHLMFRDEGGARAAGDLLLNGSIFAGVPLVWWALVATMALVRLGRYHSGFAPPLPLKGRLRTGRLVIPRYDQVYAVPVMLILIGALGPRALDALGTPRWALVGASVFFLLAMARLGPPSFETWSRTGLHRIKQHKADDNIGLAD